MSLSVAIVGAGPAGFYTAEALLECCDDVTIDIIERLASPFGLVRAGVAPDHQSTKKVARRFTETAEQDRVRFYGNVEVGRDVTLDELRELYDAVVLAVGAPTDRPLTIPGARLPGVYGASAFVGWYNAHPDYRHLAPNLGTNRVVVIGNGNVALDVARVLVLSAAELSRTDIADYAAHAIAAAPIRDVVILGRRGPSDAKFSPTELREMGDLQEATAVVDPHDLVGEPAARSAPENRAREKNLAILREFAARTDPAKPKQVHFRFFRKPVRVLGQKRVEGVVCERTRVRNGGVEGTGELETIPCGVVVAAIGYWGKPIPGVPYDEARGVIANQNGRVAPGLYAVGWAKRGPTGVIGTNRPDGIDCARQIRADLDGGVGRPGRSALERLLAARRVRVVTFEDWLIIDRAEVAAAGGAAPRRKFASLPEMLAVLGRRRRWTCRN